MAQPTWSQVNGWEGDDESNDCDKENCLSDAPSKEIPIQSQASSSQRRYRSKPLVSESEDEREDDDLIPKWQRVSKKQKRTPLREIERNQKQQSGDPLAQGLSDVKGLLEKAIQKIESNEKSIQKLESRFEARMTFKSRANQKILEKLIREVRAVNPTYNGADVRVAAYRFFKSQCEEASLQRRGKAEEKRTSKRRHERIHNKKKEREAAVLKSKNMTKEQKEKWIAVMVNQFMSSEESDVEDDEEIVSVHPLPWRSKYVSTMFGKIDDYNQKLKSPQARRQTKPRRVGAQSLRLKPSGDFPPWSMVKEGESA